MNHRGWACDEEESAGGLKINMNDDSAKFDDGEWISVADYLARQKRVKKFEKQMNKELAQTVKELRAKGIMPPEDTSDRCKRDKTGIGAVVGLFVGIAIGAIMQSPLAMIIAGFVCALAGDTIEEESKKGLKK